jgi:hypothetical protein
MQIHFSADDFPAGDRIRSWCGYFAKHAHSITPDETQDPNAFHAEADGWVAGEFALFGAMIDFGRLPQPSTGFAAASCLQAPQKSRVITRGTPELPCDHANWCRLVSGSNNSASVNLAVC